MLRDATPADLPRLVKLGALMHSESPVFNRLPYDDKKILATLTGVLLHQYGYLRVIEKNDEVIGALVGMCVPYNFNNLFYATELFMFISPSERGGFGAMRLIRDFRQWAMDKGAQELALGISTGVHAEATAAFYEKLGIAKQGTIHRQSLV